METTIALQKVTVTEFRQMEFPDNDPSGVLPGLVLNVADVF